MDSEMEVSEDTGWRLPDLGTAMIKLRDALLVGATIALLLYAATTAARHADGNAPAQPAAVARCDAQQGCRDKP